MPSPEEYAHEAVTVPSSGITPSDSIRIGIAGALDRSILTIVEYAPNVWLSPTPATSLTRTYHVTPVSSPEMFHALVCVLLTMYVSGSSVDSHASS